ncbi:Transmembrane protein 65 [Seminavis robusta]|uniref:Transmembrane protein 65 n=1 Tax=Seminavis robusta TaxID=568900 RepID=A0A9N8HEH8_9STRA|nr:Transmembrane protein 65 [Seminavis robusta]|eukprot:Sro407_g136600.1 Transmembrane protein 65 (349) ;mRNA; r:18408-19454
MSSLVALRSTCVRTCVSSAKRTPQPTRAIIAKRCKSTTAPFTDNASSVELPTSLQLRRHFLQCAVPMIGFGLMDQTVMLQAGNAIDCTIGVTFGLSTLSAAAFGQICSDAAGVLSGGTLERICHRMGLPHPHFLPGQRRLPIVQRVGLMGQLLGVILGCTLGLGNLLFMDTDRSSTLKLIQAAHTSPHSHGEFAFSVEASNAVRNDATLLTVRGPDIDGLLASMTATLTAQGCSLVELHAGRRRDSSEEIEDVFVVIQQETQQPVPDDELDDLAGALLEATLHPITVRSFQSKNLQLEEDNQQLQLRIQKLEQLLQERQITIIPSTALMATSSSPSNEQEQENAADKP